MRRVHRKTRLGCAQCKKRRVKCDEGRPSCANCVRNFLPCSLEFLTPSKPLHFLAPGRKLLSPQKPAQHGPLDLHCPSSSMDLKSLELLHHYTSFTCLSLGAERDIQVWQEIIPRIAQSYDFLLQGVLAVSALHLSTLQTSTVRRTELVQKAMRLQNLALPAFRHSLSLGNPDDIDAVFAFAGLVVPYMLAISGSSPNQIPNLDNRHPHWFHSVRGLVLLLGKIWEQLMRGPFVLLMKRSIVTDDYTINPDDVHFVELYQILQPRPSSSSHDVEALAACRGALDELRRIAALPCSVCRTVNRVGAVYIWPGTVSQEFVKLLDQRRPEALVIFAHYCMLLKRVNHIWCFVGVGTNMLRAVEKELDVEWKPWIEWAVSEPENREKQEVGAIEKCYQCPKLG
ncbi:uncharacterized protein PAC_19002 [Phialocephala subalpina]|uniref:Zn(2)-C6 fungal-type domain-containing protein n=1 Tax=Phialocephala subalpina TaxID=576137 RepID=A0A1L7XVP6_9HELO|nr:uncharacterized protein PAC_19002 [Phialocephala subalpina]